MEPKLIVMSCCFCGIPKYKYLFVYFDHCLVHSQSTSQCRGTRTSNSIMFKTVEECTPELVQVLVTIVHYVGVASC